MLDIEGTTTPIAFVYDVLFPFARAHLRDFLAAEPESTALQEALTELQRDHANEISRGEHPPEWHASDLQRIAAFVEWLMDRDRKAPGLKLLQGQIWARGFRDGTLKGEMFPDVPPALGRWRDAGVRSRLLSGSEQAQASYLAARLLVTSPALWEGSRTAVGGENVRDSYRRSQRSCWRDERGAFVSDVVPELDAARAGCEVLPRCSATRRSRTTRIPSSERSRDRVFSGKAVRSRVFRPAIVGGRKDPPTRVFSRLPLRRVGRLPRPQTSAVGT